MKKTKSDPNDSTFLFQIDVLVSAPTNGAALERLLHVLNGGDFEDFRIGSGIQLGSVIQEALASHAGKKAPPAPSAPSPSDPAAALKAKTAALKSPNAAAKVPASAPVSDVLESRIRHYIDSNKLIRLNVNKGRGVKLSIPCRIVAFDAAKQILTAYHVDEKQVHSLKLFEIDDFIE